MPYAGTMGTRWLDPEERAAWRRRALDAAHRIYNWERQVEILFAEYGRLTGRPW